MTEEIKKLTDYEHIRLRTGMYFGSTTIHSQEIVTYVEGKPSMNEISWVPAVYTAFREIIDNALDEINHGFGNRVDIEYNESTKVMSVQDNGRGIPLTWNDEEQMHMATLVLTHARAGRNFGDRGEIAGTNGIGGSGVNFSSEWFNLDVWRDGKHFSQKFTEGEKELGISKPKLKDVAGDKTGTRVEFKLSSKVFPDMTLPESFVKDRVYEIAACNPLIKIYYNDEKVKITPTIEKTLFTGEKPITIEIKEDSFRSKFFLKPNFKNVDGKDMSGDQIHSIVNNIPAFNGGVHIEMFKRLFYSGLLAALERESKKRKLQPNRADINDGLLIYNVTNMKAPDFDSQSKTRLINEDVAKIVKSNLEDPELFKTIIKKNSDWIDEIYARCEARTDKKEAKDTAQAAKKALRNKVPALYDASGKARSNCILFLAEGDSAIGGLLNVRDPEIHGGLGLRGKVLNVNGSKLADVINNQALMNIVNSIGLTFDGTQKREDLRYGKVYIAHDMDEDGKNIGALLINFFHTYWPELFDKKQDPFFYIFMTPYVKAVKNGKVKFWYARNYHEFDPSEYSPSQITRAKGLGTLMEDDWKYSLENPELFPIVDDGKMTESLDLIFNGLKSDDRKKWISL